MNRIMLRAPLLCALIALNAPAQELDEAETCRTCKVYVKRAPLMPGTPAIEGNVTVTIEEMGLGSVAPTLKMEAPRQALSDIQAQAVAVAAQNKLNYAMVSATVYDGKRTNFRIYPNGKPEEEVTGWSNVNFLHLSSIGKFPDAGAAQEELQWTLLPMVSETNTKVMRAYAPQADLPVVPTLPEFDNGGAVFSITSGHGSEGAQILRALHKHYETNFAEFREAFEARKEATEARKAELNANPPKPEDVHIRVWKTK